MIEETKLLLEDIEYNADYIANYPDAYVERDVKRLAECVATLARILQEKNNV